MWAQHPTGFALWTAGFRMKTAVNVWAAALLAGLPAVKALFINGSVIAPCDSPIYCQGDLLREIELARPFADSKTFVDL